MTRTLKQLLLVIVAAGVVAAAGYYAWTTLRAADDAVGLTSGNGRIEATEIDVATKLAGKVDAVLVEEGAFVRAGQPLARIQVLGLQAQRDEAVARRQQAVEAVAGAEAQVALRVSDHQAVAALVVQRDNELDAARRRLARSETLAAEGAASGQELDDDRARARSAEAALAATRAQLNAAEAAVAAARTQTSGARSAVVAADATIARIDVEIGDAVITAPRDARVQYVVAQPGEVLGPGGKVLNLVDLTDVYMSFFLPETVAGRVGLGADVRVVLDVAPEYVIPAKVSFVASTAQFTPRTVETASERQKLMFRVKARIDRALLVEHLQQVKTGLPGVAWVRSDPRTPWPAFLTKAVR